MFYRMPSPIHGGTNAAVMMIGEEGAAMIIEDHQEKCQCTNLSSQKMDGKSQKSDECEIHY